MPNGLHTHAQVSNHYAAMPSMHAGYAGWVSLTLLQVSRAAALPSALQWVRLFALID